MSPIAYRLMGGCCDSRRCARIVVNLSIPRSVVPLSPFPMSFPLNPAQREAVRYLDGPLLVLAGAGSGKTRVIAAKIGHLIERGHDPKRIAAITFTNRAAREMRERAAQLLATQGRGALAADLAISTFHSLGGEDSPPRRKSDRTEARILDPRPRRHRADRRRADRHHRSGAGTRGAMVDQPMEERARRTAAAGKAAKNDDETVAAAGVQSLRRNVARLAGGRLRRPDRVADRAPRLQWRRRREVERTLRSSADRRIPGHEPRAIPAAAAPCRRARVVHRGRRRRPGDLRLARCVGRQSRAAAARLSRR